MAAIALNSMFGSAVVYAGVVAVLVGFVFVFIVKPVGLALGAAGVALVGIGLLLPARDSRAGLPRTRLDDFAPVWQFREHHSTVVAAPPAQVFAAIKRVRADEIRLFRTLTWLRRGGRRLPESILNAGDSTPIIDVATRTGFVRLVEDAPRELVIGTVVVSPPGARGQATREVFQKPMPPGFALAAMNFLVAPDGAGGSRVSTETRVFATSAAARRRFAMYWRAIYPGSALIRRMWLRAIDRRARSELPKEQGVP
jgi:hypothetical protein